MPETVAIDFSPERATTYGDDAAIAAVDVIRATTTAVTAVALGRECYPVPSLEVAVPLAARLHQPLLVGELGGNPPYGFDLTNSPYELAHRTDVERPMILLSTSGTRLISAPQRAEHLYVACLRNWRAQAKWLVGRHDRVVVLGAGTRGEFREEDQLCCAWIARELLAAGYRPHDQRTRKIVDQWGEQPVEALLVSRSVTYLRETGQDDDLEFVLDHVDDLDQTFEMRGSRLVVADGARPPRVPALAGAQVAGRG